MAEEESMKGLKHTDHRWRNDCLNLISHKSIAKTSSQIKSFKSPFKLFKQENHSNNQTHFSIKAKAMCPLTNIEIYP